VLVEGRVNKQKRSGFETAAEELGWQEEPALSPREEAVLTLLAWGYTNKEAAGKLGLSVKTVDTYRQRLARKLGLRSRVEMVSWAKEHGEL
jgi:two-component system response regulator NreC